MATSRRTKLKIFQGSTTGALEREIEAWLEDNTGANILQVQQSSTAKGESVWVTITVLYVW